MFHILQECCQLPLLTEVSVLGGNPVLPFFLHLLRRRVINKCFALAYQLLSILQVAVKIVRGVAERVRLDVQHCHVFKDNLVGEEKREVGRE